MYLKTAPVTGGKIEPPVPQPMRNKGASRPVISPFRAIQE